MKKTLTLLLLITSFAAYSQLQNLRVKAGVNAGIIPTVSTLDKLSAPLPAGSGFSSFTESITVQQSFEVRPGIELGASVDRSIGKGFYFTTGLGVSLVRYKTVTKLKGGPGFTDMITGSGFFETSAGRPFGSIYVNNNYTPRTGDMTMMPSIRIEDKNDHKLGNTSVLFVNVPMLVGRNVFKDRAFVRAGITASFIVYGSSWQWSQNMSRFSIERTRIGDDFHTVSASATFQSGYNISPNLAIEVSGQYFLSSLYKEGTSNLSLVAAGLSYRLH